MLSTLGVCVIIEGVLRSVRFLANFAQCHQPPSLSIKLVRRTRKKTLSVRQPGAQSLAGQFAQALTDRAVAIVALRSVLDGAARASSDGARLSLAQALGLQGPHRFFAR